MTLRLCSYNIEWFNHLFNNDNSLKNAGAEAERLAAIRNVFKHINADFIGIVEAPNTTVDQQQSTITKLENFAEFADLRTNIAAMGFISGGTQEIAALYDPDKLAVNHNPGGNSNSKSNPPFDGEFYFDTDDDKIKEVYKNYRPPLELNIRINQTAVQFNVIVAHTKSKGIFNSMDMIHWERESNRNRLKLYAECQWIRNRIDEWLDDNKEVVVMGDFNDGPGMDFYEFKHGRSAIEIIMGDIFYPDKILKNLADKPKWTAKGWQPSTARFKDRFTEDYVNVCIDHLLVSQGLRVVDSSHTIWNPYENNNAEIIKDELKMASDHFPISIDLDI